MVSRANLSGRRSGGGILGRVQRGPQNPAQDPSRAGIRPGRAGITDRATTNPVEGPDSGVMSKMQKNVAMRDKKTMTGRKPSRPRSTIYDVAETRSSDLSSVGPESLSSVGRVSTTEQLATRGRPDKPEVGLGPIDEGGVPIPGQPTAPRGLAAAVLAAQKQRNAPAPPPDTSMVGVKESLGAAYVDPMDAAAHARRGFAERPMEGGTDTEQPTRRLPRTRGPGRGGRHR